MAARRIEDAIEAAALWIGRLDARISASPLREAWQVRACVQAGVTLAGLDGTPTRAGDVAALMCGVRTPSPDGHGPAAAGLAWWRLGLARVPLSQRTLRLVGRQAEPRLAVRELQEDWDMEDAVPRATRESDLEDLDGWAKEQGARALEAVRAAMSAGGGLRAVAAGVRASLRSDPDPGFWERAHVLKRSLSDDAIARAEILADRLDADEGRRVVARMRERLAALVLNPPSRTGAAHLVVADALRDSGMTAERLSCLTGGTKRLGMEGRLDDRALGGFLRVIGREAREGLALLDALESTVARWARSEAAKSDVRSSLPDVLHAFLVLPSLDVDWLCAATRMEQRVAQKFVRRLADADLVVPWAERRTVPEAGTRSAEVRVWMAAGLDAAYRRALGTRGPWTRAGGASVLAPGEAVARAWDADLSVPMSEVFRRFDGQIADIDREYGHLMARDRRR